MDFNNLFNSVWCVVITMTTIGYGDFFPRTIYGRIMDIIVAVWGIFIVSLTVVVLNNTLASKLKN
jgi:potassium intermediate/small conductance calcium-activated channel subfamily N protein 2